ncbi:MAG: T9SS type A sorting domain-containing protein [Bacteroidia bacterium]|nr:T9SS type A sorting domain-containing protein [Bacteroidia bacterium]
MKKSSAFLTKSKKNLIALLLFALVAAAGPLFAQTIYRVGPCSNSTHPNLQSAYNDVVANGWTNDYVIEICTGTRWNEHLVFPEVTTGKLGKRLTIRSVTGNPADVVYMYDNPNIHEALLLESAKHIDFEGITFNVLPATGRTTWQVVEAKLGAGDITFSNCNFEAPGNIGSLQDYNYAVCWIRNASDDFAFSHCVFAAGSVGVLANSPGATHPVNLNLDYCTFAFNETKGVRINQNFQGGMVSVTNSQFYSMNSAPEYFGVLYESTQGECQMNSNFLLIENKDLAKGIETHCPKLTVIQNNMNFQDCIYTSGVDAEGEVDEVVVQYNVIDQLFAITERKADGVFEGIKVKGLYQNGSLHTNSVEIKNNNLLSRAGSIQSGIFVGGHNGRTDLLTITENHLNQKSSEVDAQSWLMGILVQGYGTFNEFGPTQINFNELIMEGGEAGRIWGIAAWGVIRRSTFGVFNNELRIAEINTNDGLGIDFWGNRPSQDETADPKPLWVGNNTISMECEQNQARALQFRDADNARVYHNTIHLFGGWPTHGVGPIAMSASDPSGSMTDLKMYNNIFSNQSNGFNLDIQCQCLASSNYNLYDGSGTIWGFTAQYEGNTYLSLGLWQSATGFDANGINAIPLFISSTDLHLQANSPGIDHALFTFYPVEANQLTKDIDLQSRPQGFAPDMGADERSGFNKTNLLADEDHEITVWPNPTRGEFQILLPEGTDEAQIRILNLNGALIFQENQTQLQTSYDLTHEPAGIYLLEIQIPGKPKMVRKLIRQ